MRRADRLFQLVQIIRGRRLSTAALLARRLEVSERTVYRDRDVPWGYVVVFPADGGKVTVETKDAPKDATERLIGQVVSGVLGSADAVKAAVKELLGEGKAKADPAPAG